MVRLPRRPREPLPALGDETVLLDVGSILWRVYAMAGPHPATWSSFRSYGPVAAGRFDHHPLPTGECADRRILYAGLQAPGCLAEVFSRTRLIDRWIDEPYLCAFRIDAPLVLLDLRGSWPTRAGGSQALATGPHSVSQAWSRAIHEAYRDVAGLAYRSCMAGEPDTNVVLYERSEDALPSHPTFNTPLSHRGLDIALRVAAARFGYGLR